MYLRRLVLPSSSIGAGLRFLSVGARWPRGRGRLLALVERVQSAGLVVMVGHAVVAANACVNQRPIRRLHRPWLFVLPSELGTEHLGCLTW